MAKRSKTVTDLAFTNGRLPCANTVKEISHMVVALVESNRIARQWRLEKLRIAGFNRAACDPDPAIGSFKFHAMLLPSWIFDCAIPFVGRSAMAGITFRKSLYVSASGRSFFASASWLSSTSHKATMRPNCDALFASPLPMPPQPISAIAGQSSFADAAAAD